MGKTLTPKEAFKRMWEIFLPNKKGWVDTERAHEEADKFLCELLRSSGYGEVANYFEEQIKWYS